MQYSKVEETLAACKAADYLKLLPNSTTEVLAASLREFGVEAIVVGDDLAAMLHRIPLFRPSPRPDVIKTGYMGTMDRTPVFSTLYLKCHDKVSSRGLYILTKSGRNGGKHYRYEVEQ